MQICLYLFIRLNYDCLLYNSEKQVNCKGYILFAIIDLISFVCHCGVTYKSPIKLFVRLCTAPVCLQERNIRLIGLEEMSQ